MVLVFIGALRFISLIFYDNRNLLSSLDEREERQLSLRRRPSGQHPVMWSALWDTVVKRDKRLHSCFVSNVLLLISKAHYK